MIVWEWFTFVLKRFSPRRNWECAEWCAALTGEAFSGANNHSALLATCESVSFKVAIAYCNPKKTQETSENIFGWSPFGSNLLHEARTLPHNGHCFSGQNNFQSHLSIREISVSTRRCQYAPVFFFRFEKPVKVFSPRDKYLNVPESEIFHVPNVIRRRNYNNVPRNLVSIIFIHDLITDKCGQCQCPRHRIIFCSIL